MILYPLFAVYSLTDDLRLWIMEEITSGFIRNGVVKVAYLYSTDYLTKLGLESLYRQMQLKVKQIKRNYFDNVDKALEWLNKD